MTDLSWLWAKPPKRVFTDDTFMDGWTHDMLRRDNEWLFLTDKEIDRLPIVRAYTYRHPKYEVFPDKYIPRDDRRPVIMHGSKAIIRSCHHNHMASVLAERYVSRIKYFCVDLPNNKEAKAIMKERLRKHGLAVHGNLNFWPFVGHIGNDYWQVVIDGEEIILFIEEFNILRVKNGLMKIPPLPKSIKVSAPSSREEGTEGKYRIRLTKKQRAFAALTALEELGLSI